MNLSTYGLLFDRIPIRITVVFNSIVLFLLSAERGLENKSNNIYVSPRARLLAAPPRRLSPRPERRHPSHAAKTRELAAWEAVRGAWIGLRGAANMAGSVQG